MGNESHWKILLIEDNEDDYLIARDLLQAARPGRFELRWSLDLPRAQETLAGWTPDILLVDYELGAASGVALLRALREQGCRAPAVLLTGHPAYAIDVQAMQAGFSDYLEKSQLTAPLLERAIRYALERHQQQSRLEQLNAELEARVAERTRALEATNRAQRAAGELIERIFSTIHLAIAYMDRDFNFIRVNPKYAEFDNREEAYFTGKNHFVLYPHPENEVLFRQVVETGEPLYVYDRPFVYSEHPERGVTYWDWSLQPVKEDDGQVSGLILSLLNVTEPHRNLQALNYHGYLMEQVHDAVIATDAERRFTSWNRAAEQIYGWSREEVLGKPAADLFETDFAPLTREEVFRQVGQSGSFHGESLQRCRDGRRIPVEMKINALYDDSGKLSGYVSINRDITLRRQAEQQVLKSQKRLEAQAELSSLLGEANLDAQKIFDILARRVAELIGDACVVTRLDEAQGLLVPLAFYHPQPEAHALIRSLLDRPSRLSEGYAGQAAASNQSLRIAAVPQETLHSVVPQHFRPFLDRYGVHSLLIVPLRVKERMIGTLGVSRDQPGSPYTEEDQLFLEALAGQAALWIENASLFQAVQTELAERRRMEAELQEIKARLIDGSEAERLQLARELHDGPIQDVYGLSLQLRLLEDLLPPKDREEAMAGLQASIERVVDSLRAITMSLRPPVLTRFGVLPAIRDHARQSARMQPGLHLTLDLPENGSGEDGADLSERVRLALFRIYQIAFTNVIRHASAQHIMVRVTFAPESVNLEITDDGVGFQVPDRWIELARQGHLGLVGALERVESLGGHMQVTSRVGGGTTFAVSLPKVA